LSGDNCKQADSETQPMSKRIEELECSFCGANLSKEPGRAVAGPRVFICRDCVGICIEVMAAEDAEWREQKIKTLNELRGKPEQTQV